MSTSNASIPRHSGLRGFLLPTVDRRYLLRVLLVAAAAFVLFRHVTRPMWVRGGSMAPTYRDGQFLFAFNLRYTFAAPRVGDIVTVQLAGPRVAYLKRVVALEGDSVAFRDGYLYVNGMRQDEPYVAYRRTDWQLPARDVKPGHVYVVGDNRGMPMHQHHFGQAPLDRIRGVPLW